MHIGNINQNRVRGVREAPYESSIRFVICPDPVTDKKNIRIQSDFLEFIL